jgi:hypothetical protein
VRLAVVAALAVAVTADLRSNAFQGSTVPPLPAFYRALTASGAKPRLLEAPMVPSGAYDTRSSVCAYWQSIHGGRTSAGYSGHDNDAFNERVYHGSPFSSAQARRPNFLDDPDRETLGIAVDVNFRDYVWLYARHHRFDWIVLHQWPGAADENRAPVDRLEAVLRDTRVASDAGALLYDPERLDVPTRPVFLPTEGWLYGVSWRHWPACPTSRTARVVVFNPTPRDEMVFHIAARAFKYGRTARLMSGGRELSRFEIAADGDRTYTSTPFTLDAGLTVLELVCDGKDRRPNRVEDRIDECDDRPYSLLVSGVKLGPAVRPARNSSLARRGASERPARATR